MRIPVVSYAALRARETLERRQRLRRLRQHGYTRANAAFWATRDGGDPAFFDGSWETRDAPLRHLVADHLAAMDAASYLEVGCGAGPTLHQLARRRPDAAIAGCDISPGAIAYAEDALAASGAPVTLRVAPAGALPCDDGSFDVVVTCGLLVCVGPDEIAGVIAELRRVARRRLLLVEGGAASESHELTAETTYWRRDYARLLPGATISAVPPHAVIGHMDAIVDWPVG